MSGGVLSSTSNTRPGLVIYSSPWVEGHLDSAEAAGGERVVEGLPPSGQGVDGADHPLQGGMASEVDGEIERGNGPGVGALGRRGVGPDELELPEPDRGQVGALVRHAGEDDASARPGRAQSQVQPGASAGGP